jgi:hypothetical protein
MPTGARKVPAEAPIGFVPIRWRGYLDDAVAAGDATAYRLRPRPLQQLSYLSQTLPQPHFSPLTWPDLSVFTPPLGLQIASGNTATLQLTPV